MKIDSSNIKLSLGSDEVQKAFLGSVPVYEQADRFTLLYEWNPINWASGDWFDRVSGYTFSKIGTPTKGTDEGTPYISVDYNNCFRRPGNVSGPAIPRNWMWEITFMRTVTVSGKDWVIVDWGSYGSASNGGIGLILAANGKIRTNCKPTNNTVVGNVTHSKTFSDNVKYTVRMGCEMYSATQDIQWIEVDGVKVTASTPHDPFVGLNKPGLGRFFGRGCINNTAGSIYHNGSGRIYAIRIYKDNKTS